MASNTRITYTMENPYRISSSDALYPTYAHQIKVMRSYMIFNGPMWIQILGCELRQYASVEEVKAKMRFVLSCSVNAEGDNQEFDRLMHE
jgi:hypothetical protein